MFIFKKVLIYLLASLYAFFVYFYADTPQLFFSVTCIQLFLSFSLLFFLLGKEFKENLIVYGLSLFFHSLSTTYLYSLQNTEWTKILLLALYIFSFLIFFEQMLYYGRVKIVSLPRRSISIFTYSIYISVYLFLVSLYSLELFMGISLWWIILVSILFFIFHFYFLFWLNARLFHHVWIFVISGALLMTELIAILGYWSLSYAFLALVPFALFYVIAFVLQMPFAPLQYLKRDLWKIIISLLILLTVVLFNITWI